MQPFGDYLRKERESRNISLSEASHSTKIPQIYLDCLEKDDYSKLPGGPYIKGYISSYAEFLGINKHDAIKLYDSIRLEKNKKAEIPANIPKDKKRTTFSFLSLNKKIWIVLSFSFLFLFTVGLYYLFFQGRENSDSEKNHHEQTKKLQSTIISKTGTDITQLNQSDNSLQPREPDGFNKPIVANKNDKKRQNDSVSQMSASSEDHRQKLIPVEATPNPLIYPLTRTLEKTETRIQKESVIDIPDRKNILPPEQSDPSRVNQIKTKRVQHQSDPSLAYQSLQAEDGNKSENNQAPFENNIEVVEATACLGIKNHSPLELGDSFEWSIDRVYIWSSLKCEKPPSSIRHIYYFKGEKVSDIFLEVRSSNWRTWSYKTIFNKRYVGLWRVDITEADGKLLQSINFKIR